MVRRLCPEQTDEATVEPHAQAWSGRSTRQWAVPLTDESAGAAVERALFGLSAINLTADGAPVVVRDVGPDSFALESSTPLEMNSEHQFEFKSYGLTSKLTAVVRRCEKVATLGGTRFIVGFTTTYRTPTDRAAITGCVDVLNSSSAVRSQR